MYVDMENTQCDTEYNQHGMRARVRMSVLERLSCGRRDFIVFSGSASPTCQVPRLQGICDVERAVCDQKTISHEVVTRGYTYITKAG